jgi:hypothetical protein
MADKTKFPGEVEFEQSSDFTKAVTINDTTQAGNKEQGALKVKGGIGVLKKLHVGESATVDTGGLIVAAGGLQSLELKHQYIMSGSTGVVNLSGSATHTAVANHIYALSKAAGCTLTLPTPSVIGQKVKVIVLPNSSGNNVVKTAETDQLFEGYAFMQPSSGPGGPSGSSVPVIFHPDVTNDDELTMNGTTQGGVGTIVCTATSITAGAERWMVEAELFGSGALATPFS